MNRNARASVIAFTAASMLTLVSSWRNPVTYPLAAPGRVALRALYTTIGTEAYRVGLSGLAAFTIVANFAAWFVVVFAIARLWRRREDGVFSQPVETIAYLVLRTLSLVLLFVALAFVVYVFVVPDPRHGNFWAMLMAIFFASAAMLPGGLAVLLRMLRRRKRLAGR